MICPESAQFQNELVDKVSENICHSAKKISAEGSSSVELNSFRNPKTWKKSITNFFRNQLRSTKSNDGDRPTGSKEKFDDKEVSPEQKWQSLGKIFRRQSFGEHCIKSPNVGESSSSSSKRLVVRKVISSYFGKHHKSQCSESEQ